MSIIKTRFTNIFCKVQYTKSGTGCDTAPKQNANKAISNLIFFMCL